MDRLKDISGFMAGFPLDDTLGSATTRAIGGMLGTIALEIEREREQSAGCGSCADAAEWVEQHGGLDAVIERWTGSVPAAHVQDLVARWKDKRERLTAHVRRLEHLLGERRRQVKQLHSAIGSMRPRLMPEGMEGLVEAWPRFEDGKPVRFLDDFERYGDENGVSVVTMYSDGSFALNFSAYSKGERVNRPAPKVPDADGAEIRVGDTVYHVKDGSEMTVYGIDGEWLVVSVGGRVRHDIVTHRVPVLAADGRPLREGETVWYRDHTDPLEVRGISTTDSGAHYVKAYNDYEGEVSAPAEDFTHERPAADSWERLEEDAGKDFIEYWGCRGVGCDKCPSRVDGSTPRDRYQCSCAKSVAHDIVRRANALAGASE